MTSIADVYGVYLFTKYSKHAIKNVKIVHYNKIIVVTSPRLANLSRSALLMKKATQNFKIIAPMLHATAILPSFIDLLCSYSIFYIDILLRKIINNQFFNF